MRSFTSVSSSSSSSTKPSRPLPVAAAESQTITNQQGVEVEIPAEFICPITLQLMDHPLVNKRGVSFERSAILKWLATSDGHCPLTRIPMSVSDLIRNRQLEARIGFWRKANEIPEPEEYETDSSVPPMIGFLPVSKALMEQVLNEHQKANIPVSSKKEREEEESNSMRRNSSLRSVANHALLPRASSDALRATSNHESTRVAEIRRQESERRRKFLAHVLSMAAREVDSNL